MFTQMNTRRGEAGFTLIELAVVMIIIGLLIGGVLKGQELIANAQIKATIGQIKAIETAVSSFRDKFNALPGDLTNPTARLPNCTAAPCNVTGDGNGRISRGTGVGLGTLPQAGDEEAVAFAHLSAANLLSGVQPNTGIVGFGQMLPEAKIGGGFWLSHTTTGTGAGGLTGLPTGHYIVMNGAVSNVGAATGALRPGQAAQIDRAIDDGGADSGAVRVVGDGCATGAAYNEANEAAACALYIRILN